MDVKGPVKWASIVAAAASVSILVTFWGDVGLPGIAVSWDIKGVEQKVDGLKIKIGKRVDGLESKIERRVDGLEINQIKSDLIRSGNAATNLTILIQKEEEKALGVRNQEFLGIWKDQFARLKQQVTEKEARLKLLREKYGWSFEDSLLR